MNKVFAMLSRGWDLQVQYNWTTSLMGAFKMTAAWVIHMRAESLSIKEHSVPVHTVFLCLSFTKQVEPFRMLVGMLHRSSSFLESLEYHCKIFTGNVLWFYKTNSKQQNWIVHLTFRNLIAGWEGRELNRVGKLCNIFDVLPVHSVPMKCFALKPS